ncbi:MAG: enoyl-CoA hydratase/isomerase family protein, partial [Dehalococcoidia bacterium]|nr:enoyl-CoA hydratase/isomerase family protein [Dehalococcoidia bacterium]
MSLAMNEAIPTILGAFNEDPAVRVVVMTGAGDKAFVSGADISEFEAHRSSPETIAEFDRIGDLAARAFADLEKPLIAMIRGFCMGGGLMTAMRADIRIASDDSQFGVPAAKLGLGYGFGGVKSLMDLVGPAYAREILFTGGRFSAEEAWRMGLVNRVVAVEELEPSVRELASTIAANAPMTVNTLRVAVNEALRDPGRRDLEKVERMVEACFASDDYKEGRRAFMEKRKPEFIGR